MTCAAFFFLGILKLNFFLLHHSKIFEFFKYWHFLCLMDKAGRAVCWDVFTNYYININKKNIDFHYAIIWQIESSAAKN